MSDSITFDAWLHDQFTNKGLVDIKFAVMAGRGVSVEAIEGELLAAEAAIAFNTESQIPRPISEIPENVRKLISEFSL